MKKKFIIFLFFFSLIGILYITFFSSKISSFEDINISAKDYLDIISTRKENKELKLSFLSFNGNELISDGDNNYYYSIIENDEKAYSPQVAWGSSKYNISIKEYSINEENIKNNIQMEMVIYTDNEYAIFNVICTNLPIIKIDIEDDFEQLWTKAKSTVTIFDNRYDAVNRFTISECYLRYRGRFTLNYEKKSLRIDLTTESDGKNTRKSYMSLLGFEEDDDYTLNALYTDSDKVRDAFCTYLWNNDCAHNNTILESTELESYVYVEVIINNEYTGLYALSKPFDKEQLDLGESESLFMAYPGVDKLLNDYDEDIIESYEYKGGNDDYGSLKKYYQTLFNSSDRKELLSLVDVNNAADIYLFYNLIQGIDNANQESPSLVQGKYLANTYLAIKNINDTIVVCYIPWDFDNTLGNKWSYVSNDSYEENYYMELNPLHILIEQNDCEIKEKLKTRYKELRNNGWSDNAVLSVINAFENDIYGSGAFLRDKNKYPDGRHNESNDLSDFTNYVMNRFQYFDKYMEAF